jgi:hypothetical protein
MKTKTPTRSWIWLGIAMSVPEDWELLSFSKNPERGRLTFADRHGVRLQVAWRQTEGEPDLRRMRRDHAARIAEENPDEETTLTRAGSWLGLRHRAGRGDTARYLRHFPDRRLLLEVIVPPGADIAEAEALLTAIRPERARADGLRRWRAFGLDCLVPEALELSECRVLPADVRLTFTDPKDAERRESFARKGLVRHWLAAPLEDWLAAQTPVDARRAETRVEETQGHRLHHLEAWLRPRGRLRFWERRRRHRASAWICAQDGRLYLHERAAAFRRGVADPALAEGSLSCCAALRHPADHA